MTLMVNACNRGLGGRYERVWCELRRGNRGSAGPRIGLERRRLLLAALLLTLPLLACAGKVQPRGDSALEPVITNSAVLTADGFRLPLQRWGPDDPRAVVLALHGFTEHGGVFANLAEPFVEKGIALYAYDQRGFGETRQRGIWPGHETLVDDARATATLLQRRYPKAPLYLLGESMGGAVVLLVTDGPEAVRPAGTILLAPAVWGRDIMPWYQQTALWLSEQIVPGLEFDRITARQIADTQPTDDPDVAAAIEADPRMLRDVRADMIAGMTDLMALALNATEQVSAPTLLLYGLKDEIIPPAATCAMLRLIEGGGGPEPAIAIYPQGYHLLTRDLRAAQTLADITAWLDDQDTVLPSGHGLGLTAGRERVCQEKRPAIGDQLPRPRNSKAP